MLHDVGDITAKNITGQEQDARSAVRCLDERLTHAIMEAHVSAAAWLWFHGAINASAWTGVASGGSEVPAVSSEQNCSGYVTEMPHDPLVNSCGWALSM